MPLSIFTVVSGKRLIKSDFGYLLDFSGDEIISYLLATGAAAGFGATLDVHSTFSDYLDIHFDSFFNKRRCFGWPSLLWIYVHSDIICFCFLCIAQKYNV
ncbi:hypothetical protein K1719_001140 [Acacia pycnantha]|nr:hypothetical protein K1719_001140 [Acacia pycnantha]